MAIHILDQKSEQAKAFDKYEWKKYDVEHFGREIEWDTKTYFLEYKEGDEVVGTLELKVEGGVGKINTLLVSRDSHRKGVGKALMEQAEEITRKQNGHKMFLSTGRDWNAVHFYKAMGYKETGELNNHYFSINFIQFSKDL